MSRLMFRKAVFALLACCVLNCSTGLAGNAVEVRSNDISLNQGVLIGTVLNASAQPVEGIHVQLQHNNNVIAKAVSDKNGQFVVKGLRNGGHTLQVGKTQHPVRFWNQQSAPKTAASQMAIVVDEAVVRGQEQNNILKTIAANPTPLLIVGGASAATMIISNSHSDASP